jgi:hypothetical protein
MIALYASLGAAWLFLAGLLIAQQRERREFNSERSALLSAFTLEREVWMRERRDLLNRIQVPEAAPYMTNDDGPSDDDLPTLPEFEVDAVELERAKAALEEAGYSEGPVG